MDAIAAMLNVSAATVSNALSGRGRVSADLASKIRQTAYDMGYIPSQAARALRTGRTGVIGLVLPDISNPFFPQLAQAIEGAAAAADLGVLIADSRGNVSRQGAAIRRLLERGVDGMIVVPRLGSPIGEIAAPVVVIDSPSSRRNTVSADHRDGGLQMGRHLASLGHRQVVLVAQNPASNVQNDRIEGLKAGLGSEADCETLWVDDLERRHGAGCPLRLADKVRAGATAVASVSDLLALRVLTELQRDGIEVPKQASVSGFDDLVWSSVISPSLTTMRQNLALIAQMAVNALQNAMSSGTGAAAADATTGPVCPGEGVQMELILRQSTAPVRTVEQAENG
jgi:LacI family transcriptional regulator